MNPDELTRLKAESIMNRYKEMRPAIIEALNTINWIPVDPDNLPEGDVLCLDNPRKKVVIDSLLKETEYDHVYLKNTTIEFNCTYYAHVNLPSNE